MRGCANIKTEKKDWVGDKHSTFVTLGASNHSDLDRVEADFYATDPYSITALHNTGLLDNNTYWECAAGQGHMMYQLAELGYSVVGTDLYDRNAPFGFVDSGIDFLKETKLRATNIITNPPYKWGQEFCQKAVCDLKAERTYMFLKTTFLEGQKRRQFFDEYPPRYVCVFSKRITVARNGDPEAFKMSSAASYSWFIWERGYTGKPEILWL